MTGGRLSYAEFGQTAAAARAAMTMLTKAALDLGLDKIVSELVKLRISQINGCAFCMAFHLKLLRSYGVEQRKLDLLSIWRESPDFTQAERAALAWAEDMACMPDAAPREDVHAALQAHFSHEQIVGLNISIASINAWNRMAVAFGFSPADV